jgi:phosphotransferase system HPr-like phosphotransfer protein
MEKIKCRLNCVDRFKEGIHLRPASFVAGLCNRFPNTEFRVFKVTDENVDLSAAVNPKSVINLTNSSFKHNEEVFLEVKGKCEKMAATFFRVAWENLGDYADDVPNGKLRLSKLIDEAFLTVDDPDAHGGFSAAAVSGASREDNECRSVAIINDRLHDLTLPILPLVVKYFNCGAQIAFEVIESGIYSFAMGPENNYELDLKILELSVEVGTRITILTTGANRFRANDSIRCILENLWQCDEWLRRKHSGLESEKTVAELVNFASKRSRNAMPEFGYIQNPLISNLLSEQHMLVNPKGALLTKEDALSQLTAPHARMYGLDFSAVLAQVQKKEQAAPVILREGFAIAHGVMDKAPRISLTFGVYPSGVVWDDQGSGSRNPRRRRTGEKHALSAKGSKSLSILPSVAMPLKSKSGKSSVRPLLALPGSGSTIQRFANGLASGWQMKRALFLTRP